MERPGVGVAVIVMKDGRVLLGKRKNAHGEGSWCFPGGHLEFNEELEECAKREVMEETGIDIDNIRLGTCTNDIFKKESKHYITVFMIADYTGGNVVLKEPDRCEKWDWFTWEGLPSPLFLPIQNQIKNGFNPFKLRQ